MEQDARTNYALTAHEAGYNCAQSVLLAFADDLKIDKDFAASYAAGFGAGMRMGEVCGAISGAIMVIGLQNGFTLDSKDALYKQTECFTEYFRAENGAVLCRELLGADIRKPEEWAQARENGICKTVCPRMIASAVSILEKLYFKTDVSADLPLGEE